MTSFESGFVDFVTDKYKYLCIKLYKLFKEEYKYLISDEVVDESIMVNEYKFNEDGHIFKY